jgi:TonB family protein
MKIPGVADRLSRVVFNSLLVVSLLAVVPSAVSGIFQNKTVINKTSTKTGATVEVTTYNAIPEATEPCTPEESDWWMRIRKASNELLKKGDAKSKTKFALLLYEGQQKAYRIPLKDQPAQVLVRARVPHSEIVWTKKINGTVVLSIEYRGDGSVGDVRLIKGVGFGMDENVIQAAREALFLPAVRNGAFVADWQNAEVRLSAGPSDLRKANSR